MVFGNMATTPAPAWPSPHPATGENVFYGEFLVNAQGEDVVAGIRTPRRSPEIESRFPEIAGQLEQVRERLERHYRDMQDIEFTIERGTLYVLQTRSASAPAWRRCASLWTWPTTASSPPTRRCCGSSPRP